MKSFENADTLRTLIGPGPGRTLAARVQLPLVSPEVVTGGVAKEQTVSSNVKSPWNPT